MAIGEGNNRSNEKIFLGCFFKSLITRFSANCLLLEENWAKSVLDEKSSFWGWWMNGRNYRNVWATPRPAANARSARFGRRRSAFPGPRFAHNRQRKEPAHGDSKWEQVWYDLLTGKDILGHPVSPLDQSFWRLDFEWVEWDEDTQESGILLRQELLLLLLLNKVDDGPSSLAALFRILLSILGSHCHSPAKTFSPEPSFRPGLAKV